MWIKFENNIFNLETKNTVYQIKIDEYGVLNHVWYGPKTNTNMDYLLKYPYVGFAGSMYQKDNDRQYSLDYLPLEYSYIGDGDYRIPAASVLFQNGSRVLNLRFHSYKIVKGKFKIKGLPAVYANTDEAESLKITLKDINSEIYVELNYAVIFNADIITRNSTFINNTDETVTLEKAHSMCMDISYGDWDWIHFPGRYLAERQVERQGLIQGVQEAGSRRGTSSHQQNPAVILCENDCIEDSGFCIGATLVYSGNFQIQIEKEQLGQVRLLMGIHQDDFTWKLESKDVFETPETILSCSSNGLGELSNRFHRIIRNNVCRGKFKTINRPLLINSWETTYFDFDDEKLINIATKSAELGVEMLVLDDGWFGKRNDDNSSLGDWFVNKKKIKMGLNNLVEKIKEIGMSFGIWVEPEMVSEDSELYKKHPDWVIKIPGRNVVRSRNQLVLDVSRREVIEYLYESISSILKSADIRYVKWDMNRSIGDWYSNILPSYKQGELSHRYILGLYELLERLTTDFPDVLFEGCSGGGGRFDAGMLHYCPQIWCSDNTDAFDRVKIQYGTSFFYPISSVGSHVAKSKKARQISMEARGIVAMPGSFGYELDLNNINDYERQVVHNQIFNFKKYNELIRIG